MDQTADRCPERLKRKHGKQRSEPYTKLLAAAPRCTAAGDGAHERAIVIRTVHDLDGNEHPIADKDGVHNVVNALRWHDNRAPNICRSRAGMRIGRGRPDHSVLSLGICPAP